MTLRGTTHSCILPLSSPGGTLHYTHIYLQCHLLQRARSKQLQPLCYKTSSLIVLLSLLPSLANGQERHILADLHSYTSSDTIPHIFILLLSLLPSLANGQERHILAYLRSYTSTDTIPHISFQNDTQTSPVATCNNPISRSLRSHDRLQNVLCC